MHESKQYNSNQRNIRITVNCTFIYSINITIETKIYRTPLWLGEKEGPQHKDESLI